MNHNLKKLKDAGLKITPQRVAIMKFFEGNKSHPSINSIYENLKPEHPSLSVSTVYNTVETLVKNNYLTELPIAKGRSFYDPDISDHDHAFCIKCEKVFDVESSSSDSSIPESLKESRVIQLRKTYYIVCKSCSSL